MENFEKTVEISPAFDKRDPNPMKNYGIHGVELRFLLKGDKGCVQFLIYTNWMLPHVEKELDLRNTDHCLCHPLPADLGYHSYSPRYEGQEIMQESCPYLDNHPCYYDGSGLNAKRIYDIMVRDGDHALWKELEDYYNQLFTESC